MPVRYNHSDVVLLSNGKACAVELQATTSCLKFYDPGLTPGLTSKGFNTCLHIRTLLSALCGSSVVLDTLEFQYCVIEQSSDR